MRILTKLLTSVSLIAAGTATHAERQISFYLGSQSVIPSDLTGTYPAGSSGSGAFSRHVTWEGRSTANPPYYGLRYMWWPQAGDWGYGVELTHAKAYASEDDLTQLGFSALEFTDGMNLLTLNVHHRWTDVWGAWTPYVGAGAGVSIPHVDIQTGSSITFEYQHTGPAARVVAGVEREVTGPLSFFGEIQWQWAQNHVYLSGDGSLDTLYESFAVNLGFSFSF